jgi:hypothetical protein
MIIYSLEVGIKRYLDGKLFLWLQGHGCYIQRKGLLGLEYEAQWQLGHIPKNTTPEKHITSHEVIATRLSINDWEQGRSL